MDFSQKTRDKIDYLCGLAERKSYKIDKKKAEEELLKSYDLFDLKRPNKIKWYNHITNDFIDRASRAFNASRASSVSSDYDYDYGICVFEYLQNPDQNKPNENDRKYLKFFELMIKAKEYGAGYFCDDKDTLYIVPVPIIRLDEEGRYHSTTHPAISWKGEKLYYLNGIKLDKEWWNKIRQDKLSAEEVFAIDNIEHRRIAYEYMDKTKMKKLKNFKVLDEKIDDKGNLMKIVSFNVQNMDEDLIFYNCICPSTKREFFVQTKEKTCEKAKNQSFGISGKVKWTEEW